MHARTRRLAALVTMLALLVTVPAAGADAATTFGRFASSASPAPGYDVSWPQCSGPLPADPAFGIVGVNKGIVFSPNPCLASEVIWAGGTRAGLYASTANPGPALSTHWPTGQSSPMVCSATDPDTAACAYDYGYNAASDSYADAVAAFAALGLAGTPAGSSWWLDVETSNSWRSDVSLNTSALSGAVHYFATVAGVASLGFYSTSYQWGVITGGTTTFSAYPSWIAGATDASGASADCSGPGFTGGAVWLAQYPSGGFDANVLCPTDDALLSSITVAPASTSVPTNGTQQFTATGLDPFGKPLTVQPAFTWSVSGGGTINGSGLLSAGPSAGGPFLVSAASGLVSGTASITVTSVAPSDFQLTLSPASVSVRRGRTATYTVTITPTNGFSGSVALASSGEPAGSKVTFTPNPTTGTSTLTVRTPSSAARGTYTLTVMGTSGALTHTATATLTVTK